MPRVNVNFNEVPDEVPTIPEGTHPFIIISSELQPSKKGDQTNWIYGLQCTEDGEHKGRKIKGVMCITTEMGIIDLKNAAKACGVEMGAEGLEISDFLNKKVSAVIKISTWQGRKRNEVTKFVDPNAPTTPSVGADVSVDIG